MRLYILFLFFIHTELWCQKKPICFRTNGAKSPVVYSEKDLRVEYNQYDELISDLLVFYKVDQSNLEPIDQIAEINRILDRLELLETESDGQDLTELSDQQKECLGIQSNRKVENLIEWDLYMKSTGNMSPVIYSMGNVSVKYTVFFN